MPKPGKYGKPSWKNQYSEHDNRAFSGNDRAFNSGDRRVSFKPGKHGGKQHDKDSKHWSASLRAHFEEEDIDMGSTSGGARSFHSKFGNNRKNKQQNGGPQNMGKRKLLEGPTSWYRIYIPHGDKYEKSYLQKLLLDSVHPLPFQPINWTCNSTQVVFFVDEFKVAEKLNNLDRTIQMPNGFKLLIRAQAGSPNFDVTESTKEKIKRVLAKRYNPANKALDLTKFHADPDLQDTFCALFKPIVLITVLDIICENIPELEALNLCDNKIGITNFLKKYTDKLPNLKIFHIGDNKIRELNALDALSGFPIVDFVLDGNPVCDKFKDKTAYVRAVFGSTPFFVYSEIRKRFPNLLKLDGVDLPPPIKFDLGEDDGKCPPKKQTFLCNPEGETIVRQFLEQYFQLYDTENRQPLLQAYHEQACFSLTMAYPYGTSKEKNSAWLNWYNTDSRNLLKVKSSDVRDRLLKKGQSNVVSFLSEMPLTKHDINSFTVDLTFSAATMLCLTVSGMFKELKSGHKIPPLRHFFRSLVIVPAGSGFCIANEELHITNATVEQSKVAFKLPSIVAPPVPTSPVVQAAAAPAIIPDEIKQQMVHAMSEQSGMNMEWSAKCLTEVQWDFNKAIAVFAEVHKNGLIPPEAFVK